jgi:penicillin-binding protein-related factor A (putative recombinase)
MTNSENKALKWLKNKYPGAFIHKVADYKQIGHGGNKGIPDYLVVFKGKTIWYEVKMVKSKKIFNFSEINDNQWIVFRHLFNAGANINVLVLDGNNKWNICPFSFIYYLKTNEIEFLKFSDFVEPL